MTIPVTDYKIYCDESCHLQSDGSDIMVLGALRCDADAVERVSREIKRLRLLHNYLNEIKWTKLIGSQLPFYRDLLNVFVDEPALCFKATIVQNKARLNHAVFNEGSHGLFYYKMVYYTLRDFIEAKKYHRVYLDYMDTHGGARASKLSEVLQNNLCNDATVDVHIIRSYESQLIQICDILIGAVAYVNRNDLPKDSKVKTQVIAHLEERLGRSIKEATPPWEEKFNVFMFSPREVEC